MTAPPGPAKPPYRVPSMAEIAAVPPNGLTVASTFSGAGGSSLGYRMAGYKVVWANEFVSAAADVYRRNFPDTPLSTKDIRQVQPEEVLQAAGLAPGQLDLLDGSPPCAAFSTAGKRSQTWGKVRNYSDVKQRTDDLFFEYARLLRGLRPRAFVAENVSGLVKGVAKGYFKEVLAALRDCGYLVEARLLDAQWLGVPQSRQRLIFVGVRDDLARLGVRPAHPSPLPYRYSVLEAIPWLAGDQVVCGNGAPGRAKGQEVPLDGPAPTVLAGATTTRGSGMTDQLLVEEVKDLTLRREGHGFFPGGDLDLAGRPAPTVPAEADGAGYYRHEVVGRPRVVPQDVEEAGCPQRSAALEERSRGDVTDRPSPTVTAGKAGALQVEGGPPPPDISGFAIGREYGNVPPGGNSERYFNLARPAPDQPCPTVTAAGGAASAAAVVHPTERRKFTIAELRRICAFPDDFVLTGSYAQQWERLGRAVPPLMMRAIAETVRDRILLPARDLLA